MQQIAVIESFYTFSYTRIKYMNFIISVQDTVKHTLTLQGRLQQNVKSLLVGPQYLLAISPFPMHQLTD